MRLFDESVSLPYCIIHIRWAGDTSLFTYELLACCECKIGVQSMHSTMGPLTALILSNKMSNILATIDTVNIRAL